MHDILSYSIANSLRAKHVCLMHSTPDFQVAGTMMDPGLNAGGNDYLNLFKVT